MFTLTIFTLLFTLFIYQFCVFVQRKSGLLLLNPMLLSIVIIIPVLICQDFSFEQYLSGGRFFNYLLEPAVVALGYPLYEQLTNIRHQWQPLLAITALGAVIAMTTSLVLALLIGASAPLAISMALKSITTPIAVELTVDLGGLVPITALAIIFAGIIGAVIGMRWLTFIGVYTPKAQGLAIGAASHALGTATVSKLSFEHGAYSSLSLILSALTTALISPWLIPLLLRAFS
jgi:predicted murein hydrolase (TIGR00659 family)